MSAENALRQKCKTKKLLLIRNAFEKLGNYKNSKTYIEDIDNRISALNKRRAKIKKRTIRLSAAAALLSIITILTVTVFVPWMRMLVADKYFEDGRYDDALSIYDDIDGFSRSEKSAAAVRAIKMLEDNLVEGAVRKLLSAGIPVKIHYDYNFDNTKATNEESNPQATTLSSSNISSQTQKNSKDEYYRSLPEFKSMAYPTKKGYSIDKWLFVSQSYDPSDKNASFSLSVKATWSACDYTITYEDTSTAHQGVHVTFDYNYDGSKSDEVFVANANVLAYPEMPARNGYVFLGWYTDSECTEKYDFNGIITEDLTLFAGWTEMLSDSVYSRIQIDPTKYYKDDSLYNFYSVSTRNTSSTKKIYCYVVANETGEYEIYYTNSTYYNAYRLEIYNLTTESIIQEALVSEPSYSSVKFNCSAGDVIVISLYKNSSYSYDYSDAYIYFDGFTEINSTAKAEFDYKTPYTFKADATENQTVTFDKEFTLPDISDISRKGYTFLGWYYGDTKIEAGIWNFASNVSLTPKWAPCDNIIILNANGGTVTSNSIYVKYDEEFTLPTPTKAGYLFEGWFRGETEYVSGTWNEQSNVTLVAQWKAITYTITYTDVVEVRGGVSVTFDYNYSGSTAAVVELDNGEVLNYPTVPTRSGYAFAGWYTESSCTTRYNFSGAITEDTTLYAKWVAMSTTSHTREYFDVMNYTSSSSKKTVTASSYTDYNYYYFTCYTSGSYKIYEYWVEGDFYFEVVNFTTGTLINSYNLYSSYTSNTVSFTANAGDIICIKTKRYSSSYNYTSNGTFYVTGANYPTSTATAAGDTVESHLVYSNASAESITVEYDSDFMLPIPTRSDYRFLGWYYNGTKVESGKWNYLYNLTLVPMWEKLVYYSVKLENTVPVYCDVIVTLDYNYTGSTTSNITLSYDDVLSYPTAPARSGYVFTGWYTDKNCANRYDFTETITSDMTLYAGWTEMMLSSVNTEVQIAPDKYTSSSNPYTVSTSSTSSSYRNHIYLVANETGTHKIYWKNYNSYYYYGYYLQIYNLTSGTTIKSFSSEYSTSFNSSSFACSEGDVIVISFYRYSASYSSTAYFYFEGFTTPTSTATAKGTEIVRYEYSDTGFCSVEVAYGENYSLPTPTRTGYTFLGWYNGNTKVEYGVWNIASNVTLKPKWQ